MEEVHPHTFKCYINIFMMVNVIRIPIYLQQYKSFYVYFIN